MNKRFDEMMRLLGIRDVFRMDALKAFSDYLSMPIEQNRMALEMRMADYESAWNKTNAAWNELNAKATDRGETQC